MSLNYFEVLRVGGSIPFPRRIVTLLVVFELILSVLSGHKRALDTGHSNNGESDRTFPARGNKNQVVDFITCCCGSLLGCSGGTDWLLFQRC